LWDWLQLLAALAVPVVVGFGVAWFTAKRAQSEREITLENQREAALQEYINKMSELLLEKNLRESREDDEVRKIARLQTLTVLSRLGNNRKVFVLQFLQEAGLIDKDKPIIVLKEAQFASV